MLFAASFVSCELLRVVVVIANPVFLHFTAQIEGLPSPPFDFSEIEVFLRILVDL